MIIESLHTHYKSEVAKGNPLYPPAGMELKRVHFVVVLSSDGVLVDIEEREGMMNVVRSRMRGGRMALDTPNYMWDSLGYVLADPFRLLVCEIAKAYPENPTFAAVQKFYYRGVEQLFDHPLWEKVAAKRGHNITFRLQGEEKTAAQQPEIIKPISGRVALSHPTVYISGASGMGARLVSYGKNEGYESYGLKAGENASIHIDVAEGYTAAITALRQINGKGNIVIGDVTFLYFDRTIVALVPNAARISVRLFLQDCDTSRLESKDLISQIMILSPNENPKRLAPQFIVDFVESFVTDKPLPRHTLNLLLKYKGFNLNHIELLHKYLNINNMALDKEYSNIGYLLGRMLAIVEYAQTLSKRTQTYTIKDQLYTTLSTAPLVFFNRVMSLSVVYFRSVQSPATRRYLILQFSNVIEKIICDGIPPRLSTEDQGRFALGYHHQNQELFRRKSEHDSKE